MKLITFVLHRVLDITELSRDYVPSIQNSADLALRVSMPDQLTADGIWFAGPSFLRRGEPDWPSQTKPLGLISDIPEIKSPVNVMNTKLNPSSDFITFENYSTLNRLRRTFAYIFRLINN